MADIPPVPAGPFGSRGGEANSFTTFVETLTSTNTSSSEIELRPGQWVEVRLQATGTFDSGTVSLHGCDVSGGTFAALPGLDGSAIALTAAGWAASAIVPNYVKVVTSGGGGTQDIDVRLTAVQKVR